MDCSLLDIQTDPQTQRCLEVHERITDIVQELVSHRTFPVYEVIMQILLDRYGVNHWQELSIGPIENVPIAKHLFILNKKVRNVSLSSVFLAFILNACRSLYSSPAISPLTLSSPSLI